MRSESTPQLELSPEVRRRVAESLERVWGFSTLRPMQAEAIAASLSGRDSLVVMPTGGGKSLCYQLPPLVSGKLALVVSPLIALMKDQVDSLALVGYPAAAINSTVEYAESREVWKQVEDGTLKLLFVSPERLFSAGFLTKIVKAGVSTVAIDEAHCISQWGHDFRPEYRRLRELHEVLPGVQINAYTATATPGVRADIIEQLGLQDPVELVGIFDRPNLTYRVLPRMDVVKQAYDAVSRHAGQASIIYCISRKETETLAESLRHLRVDAKAYHAGLDPDLRRDIQDDFANERLDVVVATVAFGMGIDRSDVRCVVHAGIPKSIEHYQQETGRAGRDGLASECLMLYSASDAVKWGQIFERSVAEGQASPEWQQHQQEHLAEMQRYCTAATCRHKLLSEYFGQEYTPPGGQTTGCGACDVCLGEVEEVPDATVVAQKILSCIARACMTRKFDGSYATFGVSHITGVLKGSDTKAIREWGHNQLSTFGLLREMPKEEISAYINQLADLGMVGRTAGQFPTIYLTENARSVLKGAMPVKLGRPKAIAVLTEVEDGAAVGHPGLFDALRGLRRTLAAERGVPPYVVFSDAVLQELAAVRPTTAEVMAHVKGVGARKLEEFGGAFVAAIASYCRQHDLDKDVLAAASGRPRTVKETLSANQQKALPMFQRGLAVADVAAELKLAKSTVEGYLVEFVVSGRITDVSPWVSGADRAEIAATAVKIGAEGLKPIFEHFGGRFGYDQIRLTLLTTKKPAASPRVS